MQKFRGLYQGAFVLQTFAAHFTAIDGAHKILGIDDPEAGLAKPIGALGLAAAAVHCTFYYYYLLIHHILFRLSEH